MRAAPFLAIMAAVLLAGCAARGTLDVTVGAVAGESSIDTLTITIEKVEVRHADTAAWKTVSRKKGTYDLLLALVHPSTVASGRVPTGAYDAIQLTVRDASVTYASEQLPLATERTIIISRPFSVSDATTITLWLDVEQSINEDPPFRLTPVFSVREG